SRLEDAFALPPMNDLEKLINPKTKAILLCSPNNPTGHVYSKEDLERTLQLCKKHDIFLVVDEVYREFCYDGERFTSILTFEEYADRVVCVDSFSKRYSMCGARVGMLVSRNKQFLTDTLKLSQARLCPPDIEQVAATAALTTDPSYLVEVKKEYESRRNFLIKALEKIEGVKTTKPKGAFYIIAELPVEDAEDFATFLLRDFDLNGETVMLAPAEDFYATKGIGRRQVRIAYVLNKEDLGKAVACLAAGLKAYAERGA
ncbi:MAG TPA: aminotransferase class I/II-fold pyridoxal phosphate-dependent enzyme, partial [Sphaerochaeta sp.]|nr:aminotransferase class I/II-fold pyridoxal phosphate-dependent enzyme [Sphaerochaeta sp.]